MPVGPLKELLLIMDSITEKNRQELVARMYSHIFSRSRGSAHDEMRRIVEAPLHIESKLNVGGQVVGRDDVLMIGTTHRRPAELDAALRRGAPGDGSRG